MKNSSNTFCAGCEPDEDEALPHLQIRIPLPTSINATESPERISGPALRRAREGFSDGREVELLALRAVAPCAATQPPAKLFALSDLPCSLDAGGVPAAQELPPAILFTASGHTRSRTRG